MYNYNSNYVLPVITYGNYYLAGANFRQGVINERCTQQNDHSMLGDKIIYCLYLEKTTANGRIA